MACGRFQGVSRSLNYESLWNAGCRYLNSFGVWALWCEGSSIWNTSMALEYELHGVISGEIAKDWSNALYTLLLLPSLFCIVPNFFRVITSQPSVLTLLSGGP